MNKEQRKYSRPVLARLMALSLAFLLVLSLQLPVKAKETSYPFVYQTFNFAFEAVECEVKEIPKRVYVDSQNNVEIMLKLGLAEQIAMTSGVSEVLPELQEAFESIDKRLENMPSKEEVLALEPDLIIGWYGSFSPKLLGDVGFWHERETNTYMSLNSYAQGPTVNRELIYEIQDVQNLAAIFNVADRAKPILDELYAMLGKALLHSKGQEPVAAAILENYDGKYSVYGEESLAGDMLESVGGQLALGKEGEERSLGAEHLVAADPAVIFAIYYGEKSAEEAVNEFFEDEALANLSAVKEGRVYGLKLDTVYCSGLRTGEGLRSLIKGLYPGLSMLGE